MTKNTFGSLSNLFSNKKAVIGIIGLGYVGLPLAMRFSEIGYKTIGFDTDSEKIKSLNSGKSYISHINSKSIKSSLKKGFSATNDFSFCKNCDGIIICVPTPLNKLQKPELKYIKSSLKKLAPYLKKNQVVSLESTTYPGTCEEIILPFLQENKFKVGKDFFLVYSPEREDPGNKNFSVNNIPKIVAGHTESCLEVGLSLYGKAIDSLIPVKDTKVGEMAKLLENAHRAVNIAFINEMKVVAEKMNIDIFEVIDAAKSKPFGFSPYYPGPGIGGHCIPIDPIYLSWRAKQFKARTTMIDLSDRINSSMPKRVIDKSFNALKKKKKKTKGLKILILGLAYKKNVDDYRESPSFKIAELFKKRNAKVFYSDPLINEIDDDSFFESKYSIVLNKKSISSFDLVVLSTDHDFFNYELIQNHSKMIIDSRGRFNLSEKIYRA